MKIDRRFAVAAAAGALAIGAAVAVAAPALAHGGFGGRGAGERAELMADALGISVEELEAARDAAYEAGLDEAVEEGRITVEQAELARARKALGSYIDQGAFLAGALGITVEELQTAREDGSNMRDLLAESGLTMDAIREAMEAQHAAAIEQAVADGVITAEQAEVLGEHEGGCHGGMKGMRMGGRHMRSHGPMFRGMAPGGAMPVPPGVELDQSAAPRMMFRGSNDA